MLNLIKEREKFVQTVDITQFPTIMFEAYYEIAKERGYTVLLIEGYKPSGQGAHQEMIDELKKYSSLSDAEITLFQDMRAKRNLSYYEGKQISSEYMLVKKERIQEIIKKLRRIVETKVKT